MIRSAKGTVEIGPECPRQGRVEPGNPAVGLGFAGTSAGGQGPGRVERMNPVYTSQRCSACGHIARESRESQALFRCVACNYTVNAT